MYKRITSLYSKGNKRPGREVFHGSIDELMKYLEREAQAHSSMYHYTQWGNFEKMRTPVDNGSCCGKRVMLLSSAVDMNDKTEQEWGKRVYYTCFSYSKYEDVAMWMNYGKRSPDAIRVKFKGAKVSEWFKDHQESKTDIHGAEFNAESGKFEFHDVKPEDIESIEFADVAYVIHSKLLSKGTDGRHRGNVEYGRNFFRIEDGGNAGTDWSDSVFLGKPRNVIKDLSPFFKKRGWGYERETRLVITLKEGAKLPQKLAIDFGEVFDSAVGESYDSDRIQSHRRDSDQSDRYCGEGSRGMRITCGPWYDASVSSIPLTPRRVADGGPGPFVSDYKNEIAIVSNVNRGVDVICHELERRQKTAARDGLRVLDEDDREFLSAVRSDLRVVQRSVERHIESGDCCPNPYKVARLGMIDVERLAALAAVDDRAKEYARVLMQIGESYEHGWSLPVSKPSKYCFSMTPLFGKIFVTADLHGDFSMLTDIEGADIVVLAGDIVGCGADGVKRESDFMYAANMVAQISDRNPETDFVLVLGNQDTEMHGAKRSVYDFGLRDHLRIHCLDDESVEWSSRRGLRIAGIPWMPVKNDDNGVPRSHDVIRQIEEHEISKFIKNHESVFRRAHIVVVHRPPMIAESKLKGSSVISTMIKDCSPKCVVCGHAHHRSGEYSVHGVPVFNVATVGRMIDDSMLMRQAKR